MSHVSIVAAKDQLPNLLAYAGSKKLFHLKEVEDHELPEGAQRYEALELLAKASTIKNRIASLTATLEIGEVPPERLKAPVENIEEVAKFLDDETLRLEQRVRKLEDVQGKLQTEREQTVELSRFLAGLQNVGVSLDALAGSDFLTSLSGEASAETTVAIQKEIDQITSGNVIFAITNTSESGETFLAIFPSSFLDRAKQAVTALGAKLGPPWIGLPLDPKKAKEEIDSKLGQIESTLKELDETKKRLAQEDGPRIKSLSVLAEILDARSKALSGSSATESTVLLQAWLPARSAREVSDGLWKACDGLATMYVEAEVKNPKHEHSEESYPSKESDPPTEVSAPKWTRPLQGIIDNFGIPSYRETNPLPFMIITFPLIFGMMFGDIGGGLIFLVFGSYLYYLKKKNVKVGDISKLFVSGAELIIMLGIGTLIAGLVFGDFFGQSSSVLGLRAIFSPVEGVFATPPQLGNLLLFMEFVLLFGVAHYLSGLAINAYNKIRNKEYKHALLGPISWAIFYAAFIYAAILVVISNFKFSVLLNNPLVLAFVFIPLGLMGYGEGGLHVMEAFIGAGSNTLSYLRIWALNLADYSIKFAFFSSFGIGGAIAGNVLVLILEGLIVFVQTLRLHWVEWFGKFYEGTGHAFAPYQEPMSWIVPN